MYTKNKLIRIKWCAPNTVMVENERNDNRMYLTKLEAIDIKRAVKLFVKSYPEDFTAETVVFEDKVDFDTKHIIPDTEFTPTAEQTFSLNRFAAIDKIAREAGFDNNSIACTEFSLMPFFEAVIEMCAKRAEERAWHYSGEKNEGDGCRHSAVAIRTLGKNIGN